MEKAFAEAENDNTPLASFLNELKLRPLEFSQAENDFLMTEDENDPFVSFKNDRRKLTKSYEVGSALFEENRDLFVPPAQKGVKKPLEVKTESLPNDQYTHFPSPFIVELVHGIKKTLVSISSTALRAIDHSEDGEFRKNSQTSIRQDIKKLDSVLNSLLNYINVSTPMIKSNTICTVLEEVLEANEEQIQDKNIRVIKKCGKVLPETLLHGEQVRFILNSLLQYAILSTPVNGTIGFLTKSSDLQNATKDKNILLGNSEGYIDVLIGFTIEKRPVEGPKCLEESSDGQKEEMIKLILKLVKEILQKNRGIVEVDEKKPRTLITLKFPFERRKVVYYEPVSI